MILCYQELTHYLTAHKTRNTKLLWNAYNAAF